MQQPNKKRISFSLTAQTTQLRASIELDQGCRQKIWTICPTIGWQRFVHKIISASQTQFRQSTFGNWYIQRNCPTSSTRFTAKRTKSSCELPLIIMIFAIHNKKNQRLKALLHSTFQNFWSYCKKHDTGGKTTAKSDKRGQNFTATRQRSAS